MSAFTKVTMDVSKKIKDAQGNGEFKKVGEVAIYVPLLKDLIPFITSEVKKDDKGADVIEDGIPVYVNDEANWLQGAVMAMVKAQARNKLKTGTADLKDNNKIPENWAELTAEGVRDGAGLALAREVKNAFSEWLQKQNLSEAAFNTLTTLFSNKAALSSQDASVKAKVKARIMAFGESLSEELIEKYQRPMSAVLEATDAATISADDL